MAPYGAPYGATKWILLILFISTVTFNSCWFNTDEGGNYYATLTMYNRGNYPVHLFANGFSVQADFNENNKVEAGDKRSVDFVTEEEYPVDNYHEVYTPYDVVVTAGSGGTVIATTTLTITDAKTYKVYCNGWDFE